MLSNPTFKFLAIATLIVIVVFATISVVALSANENTLNSSQDTSLAVETSYESRGFQRCC